MMLKLLDLLIGFVGIYLMFVAVCVLNLEIECGIEHMSYDAMIRTAILALIGLVCFAGSLLGWRKLDD